MIGPLPAPLGTAIIVIVFPTVILIRGKTRKPPAPIGGSRPVDPLATKALEDASARVSSYLRIKLLWSTQLAALLAADSSSSASPLPSCGERWPGRARFVPTWGPYRGACPSSWALAVFPGWQQPPSCWRCLFAIEVSRLMPWEPGCTAHTGVSSRWRSSFPRPSDFHLGPYRLAVSYAPHRLSGRARTPRASTGVPLCHPWRRTGHPPQAQLYQRLLALDRQEAQAAVDGLPPQDARGAI